MRGFRRVPPKHGVQWNVLRGKVLIKKDAFIGANVTILRDVAVGESSVAAVGVTPSKCTESWRIYLGAKTQNFAKREPVRWPNK